MPNSRHRKKTHAKSLQQRAVNRAQRASMRTAVKGALGAEGEGADAAVSHAFKHVDKAAKKNLIHPNKAARMKSRLARARNAAK